MNFLLDTHTLLWMLAGDDNLSTEAKSVLRNRKNQLFVSIGSFWEISIKRSLGKLILEHSTFSLWEETIRLGLGILPITIEDLVFLEDLPYHHRDPFDRILLAQAQRNNYPIISKDKAIAAYDVEVVW
ncbi:MAG: type II toxin-antitoxin system VapC family toxin [Bacteroidota bacterium]